MRQRCRSILLRSAELQYGGGRPFEGAWSHEGTLSAELLHHDCAAGDLCDVCTHGLRLADLRKHTTSSPGLGSTSATASALCLRAGGESACRAWVDPPIAVQPNNYLSLDQLSGTLAPPSVQCPEYRCLPAPRTPCEYLVSLLRLLSALTRRAQAPHEGRRLCVPHAHVQVRWSEERMRRRAARYSPRGVRAAVALQLLTARACRHASPCRMQRAVPAMETGSRAQPAEQQNGHTRQNASKQTPPRTADRCSMCAACNHARFMQRTARATRGASRLTHEARCVAPQSHGCISGMRAVGRAVARVRRLAGGSVRSTRAVPWRY